MCVSARFYEKAGGPTCGLITVTSFPHKDSLRRACLAGSLSSGPCSAPFSRNLSRVGLRLPPGTNFVAKCFKIHCIPKANCYVFYKEPPPHFLVAGMKKGKARGLRSEWPLPWTEAAHGAPRNLHVQAHPSIRIPLIP